MLSDVRITQIMQSPMSNTDTLALAQDWLTLTAEATQLRKSNAALLAAQADLTLRLGNAWQIINSQRAQLDSLRQALENCAYALPGIETDPEKLGAARA